MAALFPMLVKSSLRCATSLSKPTHPSKRGKVRPHSISLHVSNSSDQPDPHKDEHQNTIEISERKKKNKCCNLRYYLWGDEQFLLLTDRQRGGCISIFTGVFSLNFNTTHNTGC